MRQYELITIFPSEEELFRQGKEMVAAELKKFGAEITKEEDMGDRELAYLIRKRQRGHYFYFGMNFDPLSVINATKAFKLNPNLLKYLFVKVEA